MKKKEYTNAPDLTILNAWKDAAKQMAQKKHWDYFVIDQFLRGNHSIKGNPQDNTITISKQSNAISFPINKIFSTFRAVRGFVTRHQPVIQVEPENSSKEAKTSARRYNKILERDNQLNNSRKINKEWVYYGVKYGVGYRQIGYDPVNKVSIRWSIDPWDLWSGSTDGEIEDAPYLVKNVKRTMAYLWDKYPSYKEALSADNELSPDQYKALSLNLIYQNQGSNDTLREEEQTKIVYECWYRVYKKNKNGGTINKCTFVEETILDHEETPYDDYPFIAYKSDIVPNEGTGEGHLKHVIAPQRMLNMLNMQILEYNHVVNKGRYLTEKNSGLSVINTTQGQIIRVNTGKRLEVAQVPPLNPIIQWQMEKAEDYIQDLGGQQDASAGRLPSASLSGDAIEALQQGDSNNISDLRDNFEDALSQEAAWILKMYSLFESEGFVLEEEVKEGEVERFGVVGKEALKKSNKGLSKYPEEHDKVGEEAYYSEDNGDYCDACTVLPDNQVKVTVSSQLGETREARMELLFKLLEAGMPLKTLLEFLEFPNVSDMMERIASEGVAETAMDSMAAGQPPVDQTGQPPEQQEAPPPPPMNEQDQLMALRSQLEGELSQG
jgi:hypothetical protein